MRGQERSDGSEWVPQIRGGDHAAYEALFRMYYASLCRFVRVQVHSMDVAEELVQALFLDIWRRRRTWEPNGSVRAYLFRAARNKALDHLKHRRVVAQWEARERFRQDSRAESPEDVLRFKELSHALQQAIDELPERRRLIYVMTRQHGLTYAEVAAVLGISVNTVEVQVGRALKHLRHRLSPFLSIDH